jgi:hypothetical protein
MMSGVDEAGVLSVDLTVNNDVTFLAAADKDIFPIMPNGASDSGRVILN